MIYVDKMLNFLDFRKVFEFDRFEKIGERANTGEKLKKFSTNSVSIMWKILSNLDPNVESLTKKLLHSNTLLYE